MIELYILLIFMIIGAIVAMSCRIRSFNSFSDTQSARCSHYSARGGDIVSDYPDKSDTKKRSSIFDIRQVAS
jgi:hypothetical protein